MQSRTTAARSPTATTVRAVRQQAQGAKPQGSAPKRDSKPNAGGAQAPKRTGGGSWMTQLGNRQG